MEARRTRSAIVTGAGGGIGRAIARRLAHDGLGITVMDLENGRAKLDTIVEEVVSAGGSALAVTGDVSRAADVDAAVEAHVRHHGELDVMVANAGIAITNPLVETTDDDFRRTLDINVGGVFNCYRASARQMIEQGHGGRLIGAASVAAHRAGKWQGAYSASKFAVRGLSQSAAQELAEHQITVNVYSPGVVQTPMWDGIDKDWTARTGAPVGSAMQDMIAQIPLGRLEVPEDVAGVVSFLASLDAAYITGQSIVVDGGMWFS